MILCGIYATKKHRLPFNETTLKFATNYLLTKYFRQLIGIPM